MGDTQSKNSTPAGQQRALVCTHVGIVTVGKVLSKEISEDIVTEQVNRKRKGRSPWPVLESPDGLHSVPVCARVSSSYKDTSPFRLGPILVNSL